MAKNRYTLEERVQVVKEHLENGKSFSEIANSYNLSTQLVRTWVKKYREMGLAGLEDRRGSVRQSKYPGRRMSGAAQDLPQCHIEFLRQKDCSLCHWGR